MLAACVLRIAPARLQATSEFYRNSLGMVQVGDDLAAPNFRELRVPATRSCAVHLVADDTVKVAYSHSKGDLYWKIGLAVDDVQAAAARLGVPPGSQFRDIGFLTHMADPAGFCIELLQTTFESSAAERAERLTRPVANKATIGQDFVIGQITTRITDPKRSLDFYQRVMGMKLLSVQEVAPYGFTLYFVAYTEDSPPIADLEAVENREWLYQRDYTTLELQHRWDYRPGSLRLPADDEEGMAGIVVRLPPEQLRRLAEGEDRAVLHDPDGLRIQLGLRTRAEAAEKECEELRNECQGQLDELARLYEEFRRAHQKVQEEKARRETIEKHLGSAVEAEQGKWTEKLAHRMSQLQQATGKQASWTSVNKVRTKTKKTGKELHTLDLRTGEWLTQAINERGREMPSMEEELSTARASAADAEHQAEEAQKSTQELQEFLSSPEVLAIDAIQQEVERMSFAEAYQDAFKPWALEQPEEAEEAEERKRKAGRERTEANGGASASLFPVKEPEIDAEAELIWAQFLPALGAEDPRTETDMGTQSPQSPISPLSPQSAYEDLGEQSPDSASYQNGQASYNQEDFSPTGDPSSPQETELERSYALDDAFEEATGPEDFPHDARVAQARAAQSVLPVSGSQCRQAAPRGSKGIDRFIPFSLGRIHSDG
ncbi:Lactoylglutathione lyase [Symbiodinium microadriaticum]|uniref:Lactoylglutathione lyase n=1 Tax=Symbiodinium microadriaticum TaxID=2951 RepID=A0A1Q9C9U3_SYMMI|nr:Lactoylglutathione lyase [Symbiodinium microadriaticum]